ncbi:MAG: hypothetical protein ACI9EW_003506, partial [Cellvibrionaceae bacterium]
LSHWSIENPSPSQQPYARTNQQWRPHTAILHPSGHKLYQQPRLRWDDLLQNIVPADPAHSVSACPAWLSQHTGEIACLADPFDASGGRFGDDLFSSPLKRGHVSRMRLKFSVEI